MVYWIKYLIKLHWSSGTVSERSLCTISNKPVEGTCKYVWADRSGEARPSEPVCPHLEQVKGRSPYTTGYRTAANKGHQGPSDDVPTPLPAEL